MKNFDKDTLMPIFMATLKRHVKQAKRLNMNPVELVIEIGGPEADPEFIYSWSDAEQEIALAWSRQLERQVH